MLSGRPAPVLLALAVAAPLLLAGCLGASLDGRPEPRPAPDFHLTTLEGERVDLSSYEGRVLMLDVMGSWCTPCRAQMPHLKEVAERYPGEVAILSVAIEDTEQDLRAFRSEFNASWDFALDTDDVFQRYGALTVPTLYVIDHEGMIVAKGSRTVPADELSRLVETLRERAADA